MPNSRALSPHRLVLIVVLGSFCGCQDKGESKKQDLGPRVQASRPLVRSVTDYAYFTGRTDAIESVNVQARVTGYLVSIDFKAGAEVKKGERLFLIDPRPYQAALDRAEQQVNLAKARLALAKADVARAMEVAKTPGAISQQDIDKYVAQSNEAQAAVAAEKANAESAKLNVEFTQITSPVDGLVGRNLLTLGNLIKQDETLLTTVVSQDPIYGYFDIDEHTMLQVERLLQEGKISAVREGREIPVEMGLADEGNKYPHEGTVDFINNRIDPTTGTLQIRGVFANPRLNTAQKKRRLLSPGMFVRIRLPIGDPYQALIVPQAAICNDQGKKYLLVVNAKNTVEYRPITLGPEQPGGLQVVLPVAMVHTKEDLAPAKAAGLPDKNTVASLKADDLIIVAGVQRAKPGMKVQVSTVEISSKSPSNTQSPPNTQPPSDTHSANRATSSRSAADRQAVPSVAFHTAGSSP